MISQAPGLNRKSSARAWIQKTTVALRIMLGLILLFLSLNLAWNPSAIQRFIQSGYSDNIRVLLAWSEIVAALLFLFSRTIVPGGLLLIGVLGWAIDLHVRIGENPMLLLIWMAGVVLVLWHHFQQKRFPGPRHHLSPEDRNFLNRFEGGKIPSSSFHHSDHIRLAWIYLRIYPVPTALEKVTKGIKNFARAAGKPELYHETITWAYVFLILNRIERSLESENWGSFVERNPELFTWKPSLLNQLYRDETLESEKARRIFVMPDRPVREEFGVPIPRTTTPSGRSERDKGM